jgi:hypothetical protein
MLAGAMSEEDKRIPLIGYQGIRYLKEVEDFAMEDFGIYIKIDDIINEESRQRLTQMALGWSQNPAFGITPLDIVKLEKSRTFSEAIIVLETAFAKQKRDQEKQQMQQMMMQQMQQQQMMQQAAELEAFKQENENARTEMKTGAKLESDQMKSETDMAKAILSQGPQLNEPE